MIVSLRGLVVCIAAGFCLNAAAESLPFEVRREIVSGIGARFETDFYDTAEAGPYLSRLEQVQAGIEQAPGEPDEFALWLHRELQAARRDGHLGVYGPNRTAAIMGDAHFEGTESGHHQEGGFLTTHAPQEGVLVFRLEQFAAGDADIDAMMSALAAAQRDTRLMFDLRGNRGGDAKLFRMIAGCLFAEPEPLFAIDWRAQGVHTSMSAPNPTCAQHHDAMITILVDHGTASTAELMAFVLQARGRAIVIGEPTYGASHAAEMYRLPAGFGLMLPIGRTYDPVTGRDWEGVGVMPDMEVASADALDVALAHERSDGLCRLLVHSAPGYACVVASPR